MKNKVYKLICEVCNDGDKVYDHTIHVPAISEDDAELKAKHYFIVDKGMVFYGVKSSTIV